jgi:hypothetical protein
MAPHLVYGTLDDAIPHDAKPVLSGKRRCHSTGLVLLASGFLYAALVLLSSWHFDSEDPITHVVNLARGQKQALRENDEARGSVIDPITITADNSYTEKYGYAGKGYGNIYEGSVIEPYRDTTLRVAGFDEHNVEKIDWSVRIISTGDDVTKDVIVKYGVEAVVNIREVGDFHIMARIFYKGGSITTLVKEMHAFYVRREINALDDIDRDAFFDSFLVMYHTNETDGINAFGENFRPLRYFVEVHLLNSGLQIVDRFHDGLGFLTQHVALTNEFETALQAINPMISVPYWDYTYEGELVHQKADLSAAWATPLWTDRYFGNAVEEKSHTVTEGRFAYQHVFWDDTFKVTNAYGFLRAPWNTNRSPFLTRAHTFCGVSIGFEIWPKCSDHYDLTFNETYDSLYGYVWKAGYNAHGPMHDYIGGYVNCDGFVDHLEKTELASVGALEDFTKLMIMLPKSMYRAFATTAPMACSMDTPQEDCHMICNLDSAKPGDVDIWMEIVTGYGRNLDSTGVSVAMEWMLNLDKTQQANLMRVWCNTPFSPGEQLEAGSPIDVSFYPIHPTTERLLHYKRIVSDFHETTWENPIAETQYCTQGSSGTYALEFFGNNIYNQTDCMGHHPIDLTVFKSTVKSKHGEITNKPLTNAELFKMMDPNDYKMPYIYDSFKWDHCNEDFTETRWWIPPEKKR